MYAQPKKTADFLQVGELLLHVETFGDKEHMPILLVAGNSAPGIIWPTKFCNRLVMLGFFVVRYDLRDTGLSSFVDYEDSPYTLTDVARDAFGIWSELNIDRVHIIGLSQGGLLACLMATTKPERIISLTFMMSSLRFWSKSLAFPWQKKSYGNLPPPALEYVKKILFLDASSCSGHTDIPREFVEAFRLAKGPNSPFDEKFRLSLGKEIANLPEQRANNLHLILLMVLVIKKHNSQRQS